MQQPYEFLVVLRRGDADAVIVDDPQIAREIGRVIARHLGGGPPRETPVTPRAPARPTVVTALKPEGGER